MDQFYSASPAIKQHDIFSLVTAIFFYMRDVICLTRISRHYCEELVTTYKNSEFK